MLKYKVSGIREKWEVLFDEKAPGERSSDAVLESKLSGINKRGLAGAEFES